MNPHKRQLFVLRNQFHVFSEVLIYWGSDKHTSARILFFMIDKSVAGDRILSIVCAEKKTVFFIGRLYLNQLIFAPLTIT